MDIIMRYRKINDINIMEAFKDDGIENKPLIIFYHGATGKKEDGLYPAFNLARNGFHVVLPDAVQHGERKQEGIYLNLFEIILRTSEEVNKIIDSFSVNSCVDTTRAGLGGISMGGLITFKYLTGKDMRIKAAATTIGTPVWVSAITNPLLISTFKSINAHYSEEDIKKEQEIAAQFQPINDYKSMVGVPLLMQNGESDEIVQVEGVKDFYNKLLEASDNKEDVKIITYPGVGHTYTAEMEAELIAWFKKYMFIGGSL